MPTEVAAATSRDGHSALAARRILRLAAGTGVSLWISQAIGWELSFIAPVITLFLLALPMARPKPRFVLILVGALGVSVYGSLVFLPLLLYQKLVGLLLVGLALFHSFYFTARGGSNLVGTLVTMGVALTVGVGTVSVDILLGVASGLMISAAAGTVVAVLSHTLITDPEAAQPQAAAEETAGSEEGGPDATAAAAGVARHHATRSLAVVAPILMWFVMSGSSAANIAVLIKVAAMGQEVSRQGTRAAAKSLIVSTLAGGIAAIIGWEVLSVWPALSMYTLLVVIAGLVFGSRIFEGAGLHRQSETWNYAYLTMIIVLAPAVLDGDFGSSADSRFYDRIFMFGWATLYAVGAVYVFDALWPGDRRNGK